jgi:predicted nucleic acid-binding Zn ribbon protein
MPTYVYETIPQNPADAVVRFEIKQSMRDNALTKHPVTGVPVRRIIIGGIGLIGANTGRSSESASTSSGHDHASSSCGCGSSCGCKH